MTVVERCMAAALAAGWLFNWVAFSDGQECYPFTAFRMFSEPAEESRHYQFRVTTHDGNCLWAPARAMIRQGGTVGEATALRLLSDLEKRLDEARRAAPAGADFDPLTATPADLQAIWLANAQARLRLAEPPLSIEWLRVDHDLSLPAAELKTGARSRVLVRLPGPERR